MNVFIIGKPGSGKGTITQELLDKGFVQLSTGDLLRQEQALGTEDGVQITELLAQGQFAPDALIFRLVDKFLKENASKNVIFDGFPRNVVQFDTCLEQGIVFDRIIELEVPNELIRERIVNRRVHVASGRIYNIKTKPPKVDGVDDVTGEPLLHRADDTAEAVDKRLHNYETLTSPILAKLHAMGATIHKVDGASPLTDQHRQVALILE